MSMLCFVFQVQPQLYSDLTYVIRLPSNHRPPPAQSVVLVLIIQLPASQKTHQTYQASDLHDHNVYEGHQTICVFDKWKCVKLMLWCSADSDSLILPCMYVRKDIRCPQKTWTKLPQCHLWFVPVAKHSPMPSWFYGFSRYPMEMWEVKYATVLYYNFASHIPMIVRCLPHNVYLECFQCG